MKTSCLENLPCGEFKLFSLIAKSLLDSVCSSSESNKEFHNRLHQYYTRIMMHVLQWQIKYTETYYYNQTYGHQIPCPVRVGGM